MATLSPSAQRGGASVGTQNATLTQLRSLRSNRIPALFYCPAQSWGSSAVSSNQSRDGLLTQVTHSCSCSTLMGCATSRRRAGPVVAVAPRTAEAAYESPIPALGGGKNHPLFSPRVSPARHPSARAITPKPSIAPAAAAQTVVSPSGSSVRFSEVCRSPPSAAGGPVPPRCVSETSTGNGAAVAALAARAHDLFCRCAPAQWLSCVRACYYTWLDVRH